MLMPATIGAEALVVLTEWPEFAGLASRSRRRRDGDTFPARHESHHQPGASKSGQIEFIGQLVIHDLQVPVPSAGSASVD